MRKNNKTQHIKDLISTSLFEQGFKDNKLNLIMKQSTIFSFWNNIVGVKFSSYTRPYAIKYNKLYVSAKSPTIIQELNLYKRKLIQKTNSYSKPLGIEIKDIVFNYQNYNATIPKELTGIEDKPVWIDKKDIKDTIIDKKIEENIKEKINNIKMLNDEQKKNLFSKAIDNLKAQNSRKNQD